MGENTSVCTYERLMGQKKNKKRHDPKQVKRFLRNHWLPSKTRAALAWELYGSGLVDVSGKVCRYPVYTSRRHPLFSSRKAKRLCDEQIRKKSSITGARREEKKEKQHTIHESGRKRKQTTYGSDWTYSSAHKEHTSHALLFSGRLWSNGVILTSAYFETSGRSKRLLSTAAKTRTRAFE